MYLRLTFNSHHIKANKIIRCVYKRGKRYRTKQIVVVEDLKGKNNTYKITSFGCVYF